MGVPTDIYRSGPLPRLFLAPGIDLALHESGAIAAGVLLAITLRATWRFVILAP